MNVIVVGGGAVGLCVAEALSARGVETIVLEAGAVGAGASAGNAGWITPSLSMPVPAPGVIAAGLRWLTRSSSPLWIRPTLDPVMLDWLGRFVFSCRSPVYRRGLAALQGLAAAAGPAYDQLSERGVEFERYCQPLLYPAFAAGDLAKLRAVATELSAAGGLALQELSAAALRELEPTLSDGVVGGMLAPGEMRVRPEALTSALHRILQRRGVPIVCREPVVDLRRTGTGWSAQTPHGQHRAALVVLANGVGAGRLLRGLGVQLPLVGAKGYSRTFTLTDNPPGHGLTPRHALYLDAPKVAVSVFDGAVRLSGTLELGARRLTLSARRLEAITAAAQAALPGWTIPSHGADWAGMRALTPDGLPYIGPLPQLPGVHLATGHATLGITLAPLTGALLAGLIVDGCDPSSRLTVAPARAARSFSPDGFVGRRIVSGARRPRAWPPVRR